MLDHSAMFAAICGPDGSPKPLILLGSLLFAGLVGSIAHCAPMCGPFVLAQVSRNWARLKMHEMCPRQRVQQGLLLPYHAGRLVTYAGLGALAAASSDVLGSVPGLGVLPGLLLLAGAVLLLGQAMARLAPSSAWALHLPARGSASLSRLAGRIDRNSVPGAFLFGVVLGFLPCGFLYAAVAVAASSGQAEIGALAMLAFGLGTVPSLMLLGVLGQAMGRSIGRFGPALLLFNALVLAVMAWQRLS